MKTERSKFVDNRSDDVKRICDENIYKGCRDCCPLAKPCVMKPGDTKQTFDIRMNKAAEVICRG